MKTGWADKLDAVIQKKLHLPCITVGRRAKYRSKDIASSDGYCQEKKCSLKISSILPHSSNTLTVTLETYDPKVVHNVHPRRIPHEQKPKLLEKLKGQSAYSVRNQVADEILTEEHCDPNKIPTYNAYRVMKSKNQAPATEQNAVLSIYDLQKVHMNCIQRIDLHPFATHYSLPSQISWYKNEFRGKKRSTISIDATGPGLVSPTDFKKYIFLYAICAHGKLFLFHFIDIFFSNSTKSLFNLIGFMSLQVLMELCLWHKCFHRAMTPIIFNSG